MDTFDLFEDDSGQFATAALTQKTLVDTENRLGAMLDVMPIGLLFHSEQGILYSNREACTMLGSGKHQLFGQHFLDFVREDEVEKTSNLFREAFLSGGETVTEETIVYCDDNEERLVKLIAGKLPWEGNSVIQLLFQDITDQKHAEDSLRKLTITDELTGAYNRRHIFYEAGLYIDEKGRADLPVSVILVDVDHFKQINDTYGHAAGDEALKQLTQMSLKFMPKIHGSDSSIFARIGGEEFLMLLPGCDGTSAQAIAERFRNEVLKIAVSCTDHMAPLTMTVSLGVAELCESDKSFDALLSRADKALYLAKQTGRNKACFDIG